MRSEGRTKVAKNGAHSTEARDRTECNMRKAAALLSEMLAHTVAETRRLQKQQEKALGRKYADKAELNQDYEPTDMKELLVLLKDIAAVTKALDERSIQASDERQAAGVVLLPQVELPVKREESSNGENAAD